MKRVLISGAAGFIGSHLCDRLLSEGYSVLGLDNFLTGAKRNIAHLVSRPATIAAGATPVGPMFEFREQDVTLPFTVEGSVDFVIHAASPASPKDYLEFPVETLNVGSVGTRHMLEIAEAKGAKFLITSTSESYGDPEVHPQTESYWGHVNPVGPRSCYDESKRFAEAMTMAFHRSRGVHTSIARIFNTFGPRMKLNDGRVVPAFLDQTLRGQPITIFGDGSQTRSFCYVSDLVDGLSRLMLSDEVMPVNLGNPREMTILEFAEVIIRMTGSQSPLIRQPLPEDDPKQRQPDISKAQRVLQWEPKVSLEEGLLPTIEYFRGIVGSVADQAQIVAVV